MRCSPPCSVSADSSRFREGRSVDGVHRMAVTAVLVSLQLEGCLRDLAWPTKSKQQVDGASDTAVGARAAWHSRRTGLRASISAANSLDQQGLLRSKLTGTRMRRSLSASKLRSHTASLAASPSPPGTRLLWMRQPSASDPPS